MLVDVIWKEEYLQDSEDDDEFDYDDSPKRLTQRHAAEAVVVKVEDPVEEIVFLYTHRHQGWVRGRATSLP